MYIKKNCGQEFWYILSGLDIQIEQSDNDDPALKKWVKIAKYDESYTVFFGRSESIQTHGLSLSVRATWFRFPQGAETLCLPLAVLRGTVPVSALTREVLYCSLFFFS